MNKHRQAPQDARPTKETAMPPAPLPASGGVPSQPSAASNAFPYMLSTDANGFLVVSSPNSPTLTIPLSIEGVRLLTSLIKVREIEAKAKARATIGSNSKPIQEMVGDFLRNRELEKAIKENEEFEQLKELF